MPRRPGGTPRACWPVKTFKTRPHAPALHRKFQLVGDVCDLSFRQGFDLTGVVAALQLSTSYQVLFNAVSGAKYNPATHCINASFLSSQRHSVEHSVTRYRRCACGTCSLNLSTAKVTDENQTQRHVPSECKTPTGTRKRGLAPARLPFQNVLHELCITSRSSAPTVDTRAAAHTH